MCEKINKFLICVDILEKNGKVINLGIFSDNVEILTLAEMAEGFGKNMLRGSVGSKIYFLYNFTNKNDILNIKVKNIN